MSHSLTEIQAKVPCDTAGLAKGATSFDGRLQGYDAQIAGNSKDALECGAPRKVVTDIHNWAVNQAKHGHGEAAIRFQKSVLQKLAPVGTDAVNPAGIAVGIETSVVDYFTEISPNCWVFRLQAFLDQIQAISWSHGLRG